MIADRYPPLPEPARRTPSAARARDACALTFDDGPDPAWTPAVLEALAEAGARATFFVIAPCAAAHPELIEQMVSTGHEVGLHCTRHVRHTELSEQELHADTDAALKALGRLGVRPRAWRTPWGVHAAATAGVAAEHDLALVGWSADTHDWRGDRAADMHAGVAPRLRAGAIVLMHDGVGPGALRDGCGETVALTRMLLRTLHGNGLASSTASELAP